MTYNVKWCLIANDGRCLDADVFPENFASYEEAMGFILGRMDKAPSFGYDRLHRFWWLRGADGSAVATHFHILGRPSGKLRALRAGAKL